MAHTRRILFAVAAGLLPLALSGCFGLASRGGNVSTEAESSPAGSKAKSDPVSQPNSDVTFIDDNIIAEDQVPAEWAEDDTVDLRQRLAEAEALFATGVTANSDGRWQDAVVAFEQATSILAELDIETAVDPEDATAEDTITQIEEDLSRLLSEIAVEYRQTLTAIGELDSDASLLAFLLRYESLESLRQPEFDSTVLIITQEQEQSGQVEYNFPVELNDQVTNCIVYFQTVGREPFETYLRRSGRYLPMMKEIVASYGLPTDLAYLPLIESGFNNKAYSYAHASGPWQFIASTGRKYGLSRNNWIDERRDFEKSTHAACQYLRDLYNMFGSWNLALASYNGGEGRVGRQIKRQGTKDFWKLKLHSQTRNYVPLYMAALMIAKDQKAFGFNIEPEPPLEFDWAATNKPIELPEVARAIACSPEALVELNPELRRGVTPPDIRPYRIRVPKGKGEVFTHVYHNLPESERTQWARHTVRRGETLGEIARRYGTTVTEIAQHNKLRSTNKLRVGQTLEIPVAMAQLAEIAPEPTQTRSGGKSSPESASTSSYRVKRGDTLWDLAKKFGTTTSAIRRANKMGAHEKLYAGQTLQIPGGESSGGSFYYTIRRGDTFSRIAAKYGIDLKSLLASNRSVDPDRLIVGQRILIPSL